MWTVFSMDDLTNRWQSLSLTEEKEAKVDLMKEKKENKCGFGCKVLYLEDCQH